MQSSSPSPLAPVSNSDIIDEAGTLKDKLQSTLDYSLLKSEVANLVYDWFGKSPVGVPIVRKVIKYTNHQGYTRHEVDVNLLQLSVK